MREWRTSLRGLLGALALLTAGAAAVVWALPASAQDADAYALHAAVTWSAPSVGLGSGDYTLSNGACRSTSLPSPVGISVPGYVDLPSGETGTCSVSGGGALTVACDTGSIAADWQLAEPGGTTTEFAGSGLIVGGVAIIVAAGPANGIAGRSGYWDPTNASTPGSAVSVAAFAPTTNKPCPVPDEVDAAIFATY